MAGLGLQGAYGLSALQQTLRQRAAEELARKQQEFQNQIALRTAGRQDLELQQQDKFRMAQLASLEDARKQTAEDRAIGLGYKLAEELPAESFVPETDTAIPMMQQAGLGGLLRAAPAIEPLGENVEGPLQVGENRVTGRITGRIKGATAKQRSDEQTQADRMADNARAQQVAEANIAAKTEGLNQAAQRLEMQGKINEADILRAQAQAELAHAKAGTEAAKGGPKAPSAYQLERTFRIQQSVDDLVKKVNWRTVGLGSLAAGIPTSEARAFKADLNTLKSNIATSELTAMREASKTGGALGQVSDRELDRLEGALGTVDQGLGTGDIIEQLNKIKGSLKRWHDAQQLAMPVPSHKRTATPAAAPAAKPTAEELIKKYGGG